VAVKSSVAAVEPPTAPGHAAIVTGGAGGLGVAAAQRLVQRGMAVVVFDRDEQQATAIATELAGAVTAVVGDVTDDADVARAIEAASALGALSVLVNVAGGGGPGARTVQADGSPHGKQTFARTMRLNAVGTFNVTRLAAAAMAANSPDAGGNRGVVINTASIAGFEGQSGQVAYAAAKAAILGMTLPLARDLAPLGVRVCAIAPATMATPAVLQVIDRLEHDPTEGMVFPARMGAPDEFARAVEMIVGNPYLNGENLRLDGALRLAGR
jgi:NAD(P)-dependent dehydrogenase (short-subunit alcohol dehydrogenase family)